MNENLELKNDGNSFLFARWDQPYRNIELGRTDGTPYSKYIGFSRPDIEPIAEFGMFLDDGSYIKYIKKDCEGTVGSQFMLVRVGMDIFCPTGGSWGVSEELYYRVLRYSPVSGSSPSVVVERRLSPKVFFGVRKTDAGVVEDEMTFSYKHNWFFFEDAVPLNSLDEFVRLYVYVKQSTTIKYIATRYVLALDLSRGWVNPTFP